MSVFITAHRARFGVAPICRVLSEHGCPIAPKTYYGALRGPPSDRAVRDEQVLTEIRRVHEASNGLYGARKVYHQLRRDGGVGGVPVARCTVQRLMREAGLRGVRRGRMVRTTCPDTTAVRAPDVVKREFSATGAEPVVGGGLHVMGEPGEVSGAPLVAGGWPLRFHRPGSCRVCVSR